MSDSVAPERMDVLRAVEAVVQALLAHGAAFAAIYVGACAHRECASAVGVQVRGEIAWSTVIRRRQLHVRAFGGRLVGGDPDDT